MEASSLSLVVVVALLLLGVPPQVGIPGKASSQDAVLLANGGQGGRFAVVAKIATDLVGRLVLGVGAGLGLARADTFGRFAAKDGAGNVFVSSHGG